MAKGCPKERAALLLSKKYYVKIVLKRFRILCAGLAALVLPSCGSDDGEKILPPSIEVKTTSVDAAGHSQFVYVNSVSSWRITASSASGESADWIIADPSSGKGNSSVTLKVAANDSEDSRTAVLSVENSAGKDFVTISQSGRKTEVKPEPDPEPDPNPGQGGGNLSPKTGWLELPAISEGEDAFTHSMTVGSVKTRNYSYLWDYDNLVASWVAYPLCRSFIGSGSRSDAWALDPLLPESKQPVLYKGFKEGNAGWLARGHQIPSADRLNRPANVMTFYGTNMTPQINNGFNSDIWANLESKVRSWANKSDTLYVVTGCVIDYKEGETVKYALDNVGKKVTVPTAYYKVVLRYQKNSTYGYSGYSACAVWLDHKVYSRKTIEEEYSMSVDELEKKLGIDFFVNLPAKVGDDIAAKIESEQPKDVPFWW